MVDALREARRVLKPRAVLINLQPLSMPITVEVMSGSLPIWTKQVASYGAPEDVAAAEAAMQYALSAEWFAFEKSFPYDLEIYCDSAADFSLYAQSRKLPEATIPYEEMEERRRELNADGHLARLRCRRPWKLSAYRKQ
jgi:hypothetical protein